MLDSPDHPLVDRAWLGFVGLNAAFVTYLGLGAPVRMDRAFTWAELPPLHARFVGCLYLFGAVLLLGSALTRSWAAVAPVIGGTAIFTTSMIVLTVLNRDAFDFDLTGPIVWTVAYTVFAPPSLVLMAIARRRPVRESGTGPFTPPWLTRCLRVLAVGFACLGGGLLVARDTFAELWPWTVSIGVAQFYGGPFLTLAWCAWSYSGRRDLRSLRLYLGAMAALGGSVVAVSLRHRSLFDAADPATWLWFGGFSAIAVGAVTASVAAYRAPSSPALVQVATGTAATASTTV